MRHGIGKGHRQQDVPHFVTDLDASRGYVLALSDRVAHQAESVQDSLRSCTIQIGKVGALKIRDVAGFRNMMKEVPRHAPVTPSVF